MDKMALLEKVNKVLVKEYTYRSYEETIEVLVSKVEAYEEENCLMAEKHAERDIQFEQFVQIIEEQKEHIESLKHNNRILAAALKKTQVEYHHFKHQYFEADDQHN